MARAYKIEDLFLSDGKVAPPVGDDPCPDSDALWMVASGEASLSERLSVLEHCVLCPACAEDLRATRQMVSAMQEDEQGLAPSQEFQPQPARSVSKPQLTLIESGAAAPFSKPQPAQTPQAPNAPAPAPQLHADAQPSLAQTPEPNVVPLRTGSKFGRFVGVSALCSAAAGVLLYVNAQGPASTRTPGESQTFRGVKDVAAAKAALNLKYQDRQFHWTSQLPGATFEVETFNAEFETVCTVPAASSTKLSINAKNCPGFDPSKPFYWKVRTTDKSGHSFTSAASFVSPGAP